MTNRKENIVTVLTWVKFGTENTIQFIIED